VTGVRDLGRTVHGLLRAQIHCASKAETIFTTVLHSEVSAIAARVAVHDFSITAPARCGVADTIPQAFTVDRACHVVPQAIVHGACADASDALVSHRPTHSVVAWISIWTILVEAQALGLLAKALFRALIEWRTVDVVDDTHVTWTESILIADRSLLSMRLAFGRRKFARVILPRTVRLQSC